jgi:hypothetical protein
LIDTPTVSLRNPQVALPGDAVNALAEPVTNLPC